MTFREAYELTGRVLNVSVIPFDRHSYVLPSKSQPCLTMNRPTKLLNYLTAPDCVIWSAVIASAAVPGILNPVVLMQKTRTGSIVPWNWGSRFRDGSLRVDVPIQSLNLLFNGMSLGLSTQCSKLTSSLQSITPSSLKSILMFIYSSLQVADQLADR
jgi:predicted acylesterase/phospholipase RssA